MQVDSDQSSQYGCDSCWDNDVAENFFLSLKKERTKKRI